MKKKKKKKREKREESRRLGEVHLVPLGRAKLCPPPADVVLPPLASSWLP